MKLSGAVLLAVLWSAPGMAAECAYANGVGPTLSVEGNREALLVNFGDWTERCPITADPSPRPDLGLGGGWLGASVAKCDHWSAQVAFVEPVHDSGDFSIVVFDGMPFYRQCQETMDIGTGN